MSACGYNTTVNSQGRDKNLFPQYGQGQYMGVYYPGSSQKVISTVGAFVPNLGAELVIQNDTNYISSLTQQPQNVLRFTGSYGASYIQSSNIRFSVPYSATAGVAILPSTGTINATNLSFLSTLNTAGGTINMIQLTSSIKGYGWADVN